MKLIIQNFSGIKDEEITFNGLTIVAGCNNTGKSTIGKIVNTLFNTLNRIEEKRKKERKKSIHNVLRRSFNLFRDDTIDSFKMLDALAEELNELEDINKQSIKELLQKYIRTEETESEQEILSGKILEIKKLNDNEIDRMIITSEFNQIFKNQINNIYNDSIAELNLLIKNDSTRLQFKNNKCIFYESATTIVHPSFYINNPFVIDSMNNFSNSLQKEEISLLDYLENEEKNIVDSILGTNKLEDVFKVFERVIPYDIVSTNEGFFVQRTETQNLLQISNLSTGIKSFLIIKRLIENGSIKEKDVLVLDEPEIHLHPEWQLTYAELIVLIQKNFNLTIFITSHSPYFIESIELFAKKYNCVDILNFYLATKENEEATITEKTDNIEEIYALLAKPFQELEKIEYELQAREDK